MENVVLLAVVKFDTETCLIMFRAVRGANLQILNKYIRAGFYKLDAKIQKIIPVD
jgi:hypothetical protein